jgi:hypothetical protein
MKPIQDMIKKNAEFKWGPRENECFDIITIEIVHAPALLSPYIIRGFILNDQVKYQGNCSLSFREKSTDTEIFRGKKS